ncbi:MAG: DUF4230 domain-containing protein [Anaerolineae bacterium]
MRAGIDLATSDDVDIEGRTGIPRLGAGSAASSCGCPRPRSWGAAIDVDKSRVYDLRESLFAPVAPDLQSRAERYALQRIVGAARVRRGHPDGRERTGRRMPCGRS